METRELLSIPQAAEILGLSRTTLYALIATGELKTRKIRRRRMIPRSALAEFCKRDHAVKP
jgi:excisionase family DNA binding protein